MFVSPEIHLGIMQLLSLKTIMMCFPGI